MISPYIYAGLDPAEKRIAKREMSVLDKGVPRFVIKHVCDALDLNIHDVRGKSRKRPFAEARFIIIHFLIGKNTLMEIGRSLNRDHSTIIYGHEVYNSLIETNTQFRSKVETVKNYIA